jgi:hypothetical protein
VAGAPRVVRVHDDLVRAARGVALDDPLLGQHRGVDPVGADVRRAVVLDGLAVGADHHGAAEDRALRLGDAVHLADHVQGRGRHVAPGVLVTGAVVAAQIGLDGAAHLHRDVLADGGEQVVEGLAEAVGEHERAGHERDAEHDRQGRQQQPELAGEQ